MEEIKACPFCGSYGELESSELTDGNRYYYVKCSNKKCRIRSAAVKVGFNERFECRKNVEVTPVMAITHVVSLWNERSDEPPVYPWSGKKVRIRSIRRELTE